MSNRPTGTNYILNENDEPVLVDDLMEWAHWMERGNRRIAETVIGETRISTVFLGLDHNYGEGPPLLYETMIFGGDDDGYQTRGSTKVHALKMHQDAVKLIKEKTIKLNAEKEGKE